MDAVKFIKEKDRMCKRHCCCEECPLEHFGKGSVLCSVAISDKPEEAVSIVKKWSEENPVIVNGARVMKNIEEMGTPRATFFPYDTNDICVYFDKNWWDAPYEEENND